MGGEVFLLKGFCPLSVTAAVWCVPFFGTFGLTKRKENSLPRVPPRGAYPLYRGNIGALGGADVLSAVGFVATTP